MTLTPDVSGRQFPWLKCLHKIWRWVAPAAGPGRLGLTVAAQKGWKQGRASGCSQVWEESQMGLQRKVPLGFKPWRGSHAGSNHVF